MVQPHVSIVQNVFYCDFVFNFLLIVYIVFVLGDLNTMGLRETAFQSSLCSVHGVRIDNKIKIEIEIEIEILQFNWPNHNSRSGNVL